MRINGAGNLLQTSHPEVGVHLGTTRVANNVVPQDESQLQQQHQQPSSISAASSSGLQHFVTFDEKGREIHLVAVPGGRNLGADVLTDVTTTTAQVVTDRPDGASEAFSTFVVEDINSVDSHPSSVQQQQHIDDNVVLGQDGFIVDKMSPDGTIYQLITEDGTTIVTTGSG